MAGETPNNSDAALVKRHKQSAIIARLTVACIVAMRSGYPRKHIGAVFEESWPFSDPLRKHHNRGDLETRSANTAEDA
jgi:hypothetical protein